MKSIHKFFLSFLLVIIGIMGLSVVSSARAVDTVPSDLTDEICFHFSAPLDEVNSDQNTCTYYFAFGNHNYAQSLFFILNVVPWESDSGVVVTLNPDLGCQFSVYCNKTYNVSYRVVGWNGSLLERNQVNSNSAGSTSTFSVSSSSIPNGSNSGYHWVWYGNTPVNPHQSSGQPSPCFFIEDIIDAQGVEVGQNIYNAISSIDSDTGVIRSTVASIDTTLDSIDWSADHISDLLSSGGAIYGFLDSLVDDATSINVTLTNIDGTLSTVSDNLLALLTYIKGWIGNNKTIFMIGGSTTSFNVETVGADGQDVLGDFLRLITRNQVYAARWNHNDLTSLSSGLSTSIQNQTDTIMGQSVQVTQPSFSDSGSVESITDDYISDLDPSSALLQDVSTPLQGMNFWRDKVNELILTNNQMSVFILYILSIGLVVFFIGRRIRSE